MCHETLAAAPEGLRLIPDQPPTGDRSLRDRPVASGRAGGAAATGPGVACLGEDPPAGAAGVRPLASGPAATWHP